MHGLPGNGALGEGQLAQGMEARKRKKQGHGFSPSKMAKNSLKFKQAAEQAAEQVAEQAGS